MSCETDFVSIAILGCAGGAVDEFMQKYGYNNDVEKTRSIAELSNICCTFASKYQRLQNLMAKITVQNTNIAIISVNGDDYISLTYLARHKSDEPNAVIANWMRNRNTIEYLGIWEQLYNPDFRPTEFEGFIMIENFFNNLIRNEKY